MELKGAEIRNLMELCNPMPKNGTENRKLNVLIPYYQRPYKWEETQIKNLFADYFKNEQKEYFVGSVVMVENHDGGFEIIDGQQRITTLFLLNYLKFIFLRAYIEELIIVKKVYKIDGYLSKLENTADNIFDEKIVDEIRKIHIEINDLLEKADEEKNEEQKEKLQDQVLKEYQITLGLPEKNLSDREKYLNQYQREPTIQELSQNLNIEKQNIIEAMQSTQSIASFQDAVGNDDQNELSLSDIISLDPETLKHYHDHLDLKNAFDCLNQREKKVIQERYYQGYSQCEIADELFVSQAQISRIEKKALEKLHKKLV